MCTGVLLILHTIPKTSKRMERSDRFLLKSRKTRENGDRSALDRDCKDRQEESVD